MQKYKIVIIGHSTFPKGAKNFVEFFGVPEEGVRAFCINDKINIDDLEKTLNGIVNKENHILFFADLTGGSPQKKLVEILIKSGNETHKVISGVPMSTLLELAVKSTLSGFQNDVDQDIKLAIKMSKNQMMVCGSKGIQSLEGDKKISSNIEVDGI